VNWIIVAFVLLAAILVVAAQDCITIGCFHALP
jgi:hypothetical protein